MIRAESQPTNFLTEFTNGEHVAHSDIPIDQGGSNLGFRPHELLEAALANCMNITVRMAAKKHGIPLEGTLVAVSLNPSHPDGPTFEYRLQFKGSLSEAQRQRLLQTAARCPVHNTLSKEFHFHQVNKEDPLA